MATSGHCCELMLNFSPIEFLPVTFVVGGVGVGLARVTAIHTGIKIVKHPNAFWRQYILATIPPNGYCKPNYLYFITQPATECAPPPKGRRQGRPPNLHHRSHFMHRPAKISLNFNFEPSIMPQLTTIIKYYIFKSFIKEYIHSFITLPILFYLFLSLASITEYSSELGWMERQIIYAIRLAKK